MELLLVNLRLAGLIQQDLSRLKEYCEKVAQATHTSIPANYPVVGSDAFRTATGIHAAAILKASKRKEAMLANTVYSGVPAHLFGLEQNIEIGPLSGRSNVVYWLEKRGLAASEKAVGRILEAAKKSSAILTESEIRRLYAEGGSQ
jgi:2-isopropylmalate synthase